LEYGVSVGNSTVNSWEARAIAIGDWDYVIPALGHIFGVEPETLLAPLDKDGKVICVEQVWSGGPSLKVPKGGQAGRRSFEKRS
jgi:hypothetical protein